MWKLDIGEMENGKWGMGKGRKGGRVRGIV
jgi:hypothetical protein